MNTRFFLHVLSAVLVVAIIASCQNPTQPTDLTASRTLTLEVRTSANDALSNVTIDWIKFTGLNAPIGSVARTGEDGFAQFVVPDVSTSRDSIRMTLTMPPSSPFASMGPIVVETSVCSDTLISVAVAPETPCGTLNLADTIVLEACPQAGSAFANECRIYPTSCPGGVVFTSATTTSGAISVALRSFGNASSAVEVCASYQPPTSTPAGQSESFLVVVEGRSSVSPTVQVRLNLLVIGRTTCEPCPCPTIATGRFTTETVCVGDNLDVLVPLDSLFAPITSSADCIAEFNLVSGTNDVFTVSSGSSFFVRSGQRFPTIDLAIDAVSTGQIKTTLEYEVRTRNLLTGVETVCPDRLKIELTTNVVASACSISRTGLDTLQKCVFNDSSSTDTLTIVNTGQCPLTITVRTDNSLFEVSPSGSVTIPAGGRRKITVSLLVTKSQWDNNSQAPKNGRGDKDFAGTLEIIGCTPQPTRIALKGVAYVQCNAFKYQCLRQFRPPGFPNTYAESIQLIEDKTTIVYQNDNQRFQQFDIYIKSLTPSGTSFDVELASGSADGGVTTYGVFSRVATGFTVNPGESICDRYPANAITECTAIKGDPTAGSSSIAGLRPGDVVLYVKIGSTGPQCALIWIQAVGLDRPGASSLPQACIEICYPMFTL